jgi:hypothetical protein
VYTFIGTCTLDVDHEAKSPDESAVYWALPKVWTQYFQCLGPDLPKAEFKKPQTDRDNFIKREIIPSMISCHLSSTWWNGYAGARAYTMLVVTPFHSPNILKAIETQTESLLCRRSTAHENNLVKLCLIRKLQSKFWKVPLWAPKRVL